MRIRQSNWIPFGIEADRALLSLSANAARLFFYLYFRADRQRRQLWLRYGDVAEELNRSKRSLVTDFGELREKGLCRIDSAVNQHAQVHIEICDEFWPYEYDGMPVASNEQDQYVDQIYLMLKSRPCIKCSFGASDRRFVENLFVKGISIEQVRGAIELGCLRKYVGMLNGTDAEPIGRLSYFRDLIEEAGQADTQTWEPLNKLLLDKYEAKWIKKQNAALLNFASARRSEKKETR